jgi:hypothetical protein
MSGKIMMLSDDGKVYKVDPKQVGKLAKRVPLSKLSPAVKTNIETAGKNLTGGKGVAHILATKSDILTAGKSDILVAGKQDTLASAKSDILISGKQAKGKADILISGKAAKTPAKAPAKAAKSDILVAGKAPAKAAKADILVSGKTD